MSTAEKLYFTDTKAQKTLKELRYKYKAYVEESEGVSIRVVSVMGATPKLGEQLIYGKVKVVPGLWRALWKEETGKMFEVIIEMFEDNIGSIGLDDAESKKFRDTVLLEQLYSIVRDAEKGTVSIRKPDIQGFQWIQKKFGNYKVAAIAHKGLSDPLTS